MGLRDPISPVTKSHLSRRGVFSYDEMDIKVLELLRIVYFPPFTIPAIAIRGSRYSPPWSLRFRMVPILSRYQAFLVG